MRFIFTVKASTGSEAGHRPCERQRSAIIGYHEELARAGILLDAAGLYASTKGWRIRYSGARRTMITGPFPRTRELIAGYTLIQVRTRNEALEWSRRFPNPAVDGKRAEIEVRQLFDAEDIEEDESSENERTLAFEHGG